MLSHWLLFKKNELNFNLKNYECHSQTGMLSCFTESVKMSVFIYLSGHVLILCLITQSSYIQIDVDHQLKSMTL